VEAAPLKQTSTCLSEAHMRGCGTSPALATVQRERPPALVSCLSTTSLRAPAILRRYPFSAHQHSRIVPTCPHVYSQPLWSSWRSTVWQFHFGHMYCKCLFTQEAKQFRESCWLHYGSFREAGPFAFVRILRGRWHLCEARSLVWLHGELWLTGLRELQLPGSSLHDLKTPSHFARFRQKAIPGR
jgi:hypothetical protein